jgi:aryl-alcohol dehydrogenase-like predicted oxidoreductase
MRYRRLGRSGLKLAPIGLGTDNFANPVDEPTAHALLDRAVAAGINLVDTSNSYGGTRNAGESERIIGRWLQSGRTPASGAATRTTNLSPGSSRSTSGGAGAEKDAEASNPRNQPRTGSRSSRRDSIVLATKVFYPTGPGPNDRGNSRRHIIRACEDSLGRLQTDRIDLYQLHRPSPEIPIEETLYALDTLVRDGKVLYIGTTTHPAWQIMEALHVSALRGLAAFVSDQPPYNLLDRRIENELAPLALKYGIGLLPWAPIASGLLAGRYQDPTEFPQDSRAALRGGIYAERVTPRGVEAAGDFVALARDFGISPAQLALLWVKDQPGVTAPLFGPRTVAQLEHILPVLEMTLTDNLRTACDELVPPGSVVANFHNTAPWMKMRVPQG